MKRVLAFCMSFIMLAATTSTVFAANPNPQNTGLKSGLNTLDDGTMPLYDDTHIVTLTEANTYYLVCNDTNWIGENVYAHIGLLGQDFVGSPNFMFKLTDKKGNLINEVESALYRYKKIGTVSMLKGWKLYVKSIPTKDELKKDSDCGTGKISIDVYDDR